MTIEPTSVVFEKAADIQEDRGFCQGHWETYDGRVCLEGAVVIAAGIYHKGPEQAYPSIPVKDSGWSLYSGLMDQLSVYLRDQGKIRNNQEPWEYNDNATTTRKDVVRVLREASAYYAEQEAAVTEKKEVTA